MTTDKRLITESSYTHLLALSIKRLSNGYSVRACETARAILSHSMKYSDTISLKQAIVINGQRGFMSAMTMTNVDSCWNGSCNA